jgi:hypothetical protein
MIATLSAMAAPQATAALHRSRAAAAARIPGRADGALLEAERWRAPRSSLSDFEADGDDFTISTFVDGNGNGVRMADIRTGVESSHSIHRLASRTFSLESPSRSPTIQPALTQSRSGRHR